MLYITPDLASRTTYAHEMAHLLLNQGNEAHVSSGEFIMGGRNGVWFADSEHARMRQQSDGELLKKE
jgi:hypothetical protein